MGTATPETTDLDVVPAEVIEPDRAEIESANPAVARVVEQEMRALALSPTQTRFTDDQLALLAARGVKVDKIPPAYLSGFLMLCLVRGVNPFIGEATIMPTEDGWAGIMQIDGFRAKAEETGEYQGTTHPEWSGEDGVWHQSWPDAWGEPVAARVGVRRRGFPEPVYAVAHTEEYKVYEWVQVPGKARGVRERRPTKSWGPGGQLRNMVAKCARAAAFRDAFPRILDGFYTPEEMGKVRHERQEAEAARAAEQARLARDAAYAAANPAPEREPVVEEGVVEGVVTRHAGQPVGDVMDHVERLRQRAQADRPDEPEWPTPEEAADDDAVAVAVAEEMLPDDEPMTDDRKVEMLRAELEMQAEILGIPRDTLVTRYEAAYGTKLPEWDVTMFLRVVTKYRKQVATRLSKDRGRYVQAQGYAVAGDDEVVDVETMRPVG